MTRSTRDKDGLTPQQADFAAYLAKGLSQAEAYRRSHTLRGASMKSIHERGSRLAQRVEIRARVQALLREAKISDIHSVGQAMRDLLNDINAAREASNWTALASLTKTRTQVLGMIKESMIISPAEGLSDIQLIERLAGGDAAKAAMVKKMLGKDDEYVQ